MRPRAWLAVGAVVGVLAGCASAPNSSANLPVPTTDGSAECRGADLLGPDGTRLDLTGMWEGLSSVWFVTQSGSCVTIEGLSRIASQRDGEDYRFVFAGEIRADFSVVGRWTWTWACSGPECPRRGATKEVELGVGFADDGVAAIEVPSTAMDFETNFTVTLERTSTTTEFPP